MTRPTDDEVSLIPLLLALNERTAHAYEAHGDRTSAVKLRVCGQRVLFRLRDGQPALLITGEAASSEIDCGVHGCAFGGAKRYEQAHLLMHLMKEAGSAAQVLFLTLPEGFGPKRLKHRVRHFERAMLRLFDTPAWARLVGRGAPSAKSWARAGITRGAWLAAIEPTWSSGWCNVHSNIVVVVVDPTAVGAVEEAWGRFSGGGLLLFQPVRSIEGTAWYTLKGLRPTRKRPVPPHMKASDQDLDDLVDLIIGSGTPSEKNGFKWVRTYGDLRGWGRPLKQEPATRGRLPRRELHTDAEAAAFLALRTEKPGVLYDENEVEHLDYYPVLDDEDLQAQVERAGLLGPEGRDRNYRAGVERLKAARRRRGRQE